MKKRTIAALAGAFVIGALIPQHGIHDPADRPAAPVEVPQRVGQGPDDDHGRQGARTAGEAGSGCSSAKFSDPSAVKSYNPDGWCWYLGWKFMKKSICIDSSIPGTGGATGTLAVTAQAFRVKGIAVSVRMYEGGCAATGWPASQRVSFIGFKSTDRVCGYTQPPGRYGFIDKISVHINVTGYKETMCGGGIEWDDTFRHELAHAFGFNHDQPGASSVIRDGHTTSAADQWRLGDLIYYGASN